MTQPSPFDPVARLKQCLILAREVSTQEEANHRFEEFIADLEDPQLVRALELLWQEVLAARRSAAFWRQTSDLEKEMADQMMQNLLSVRQNYIRLLQEI